MKLALTILAVLMIGITSAETLKFGNYTAEFEMNQPHIIVNNTIRTFYGTMNLGSYLNIENDSRINTIYIGDIKFSDGNEGKIFRLDSFYYYISEPRLGVSLISTMNISTTMDLLKTLKIKKINPAA